METEELTRLVDEIYKNILDKFNPGARQLINAGKAYLKALHGAAAASRVYVDALSRLARQAQLGTWGGSKDVGLALMKIVEVYKEIQEQEMNILKAFYVDLLVPLETNLEKDTKVVQSEQKKFLQQHKTRSETYSKAAATMKKQRKKSRGASKSGLAMDKELKNMQILEEEKSKLDAFCEQSLKNAMTQERRRQRRRKPRADRITEAVKQHQKDEKSSSKVWENDSWKTIPRDEKSWHLYRTAMDIWAEANANQGNENGETRYSNRHYNSQERKSGRDFSERGTMENGPTRKSGKKTQERSQKNEYENRGRGNTSHKSKVSSNEEQSRKSARRNNEQVEQDRRESKRTKDHEETEEDEIELEEEEDDAYSGRIDYQKYEGKKYYSDRTDGQERNSRRGYRPVAQEESKYENEKTSSASSSGTDDESTITIPETGRKVEHIAQKLEQTAQKYAREHSPPKFMERRNDYRSLERREEKQPPPPYERYNDCERNRAPQRFERERERYLEKSPTTVQKTSTYERERTFEKNPDRNRNIERASSRRFERPRPPSEEAPERPTDSRNVYRERRYSDKEEAIYGETRYVRENVSVDKERGYESNFETKLERTKVIERHGYQNLGQSNLQKFQRNGPQILEKNDTNNNTLKDDNRKPLLPRQATAVGHLIQTGRAFDVDSKSPKLVKRTKSFWRFRRDSDVLEGMALWQHRSLVDIPKMIKKEVKDDTNSEDTKKQSPEGSPNSRQSLEKRNSDVTITNDSHHEEPKPAERIHVPEKSDYFEDFPTPAERPKTVERSEYRMHQEERSYFMGNVSRKAIIEKERKRSLEAKRNMIVAELKENNEAKRNERRKKYTDDEDGLTQNFSETEASDEESTYSCIVVKDQTVAEKTLLPRTKLRRDSERERDKNTCGPWYDLWGVDASVNKKKKKKQQ